MGNPTDRRKTERILPDYPMKYVRPPYGRYTEDVQKAIGLPLVLWTIDSGDWEAPNAENIYTALIGKIQNGDITFSMTTTQQTVNGTGKNNSGAQEERLSVCDCITAV